MHIYQRLRVWQAARELVVEVYQVSQEFPSDERFGLTSQMRRAAISVPSNIAEGAGRGGKAFRQFLHYASGSAAELESQLDLAQDLGLGNPEAINLVVADVQAVRKMLWRLIDAQG